jgi:hypothetical protein
LLKLIIENNTLSKEKEQVQRESKILEIRVYVNTSGGWLKTYYARPIEFLIPAVLAGKRYNG